MLYQVLLKHAEPFALDLDKKPWFISVRAQVILGFVALGLGKGGLFISTFFIAMAWSETGWTLYAVVSSVITVLVLIFAYIAVLARIEARITPESDKVHLIKRIPFHRTEHTVPLSHYQGIELTSRTLPDQRLVHTVMLTHQDANLSVPLWQRRQPEPPMEICATFAATLKVGNLTTPPRNPLN
ncbi:hypothetical protein [Magnetovibrio blakemorei]|uniref:Uncharacterized protein n=1 Tax=Magnetovibrio blakemorei TaxID=28181 RepID=A0A1E5Q780_9PROT|nr:hypothetical protein [Magnetovibrio blakemorei]OEJ66931.1 hypothetical protein BEN30_11100 [Magnetovibrio blakemorei]